MSIEMGRYSYHKNHITVLHNEASHKVRVGNFCSIARECRIFLGGNHRHDWVTTFPFGHIERSIFNNFNGAGHPHSNGDVIIGNDVWIGHGVTIMSGVKIGDGAVVAANSHVVRDVAPYEIVGGNPAKHIRYRFPPETIRKLLEIAWWNWDNAKINQHLPLLCNPNIDGFINACQHKN